MNQFDLIERVKLPLVTAGPISWETFGHEQFPFRVVASCNSFEALDAAVRLLHNDGRFKVKFRVIGEP